MNHLPPDALEEVAAFFQTLGEPTRLQILSRLRDGECNVGELAAECGFSMANISRHLSMMTKQGMVERESRGTSVYYRIADPSIYDLCDLVCGSIGRHHARTTAGRAVFTSNAPATRSGR